MPILELSGSIWSLCTPTVIQHLLLMRNMSPTEGFREASFHLMDDLLRHFLNIHPCYDMTICIQSHRVI